MGRTDEVVVMHDTEIHGEWHEVPSGMENVKKKEIGAISFRSDGNETPLTRITIEGTKSNIKFVKNIHGLLIRYRCSACGCWIEVRGPSQMKETCGDSKCKARVMSLAHQLDDELNMTCVICGEDFRMFPSWVKRYSRKDSRKVCCSDRCRKDFERLEREAKEKAQRRFCRNCRKEVPKERLKENPWGHYCCDKCEDDHKNVKLVCDRCGKKFTIPRNEYNVRIKRQNNENFYCSRDCFTSDWSEKFPVQFGWGSPGSIERRRLQRIESSMTYCNIIEKLGPDANVFNIAQELEGLQRRGLSFLSPTVNSVWTRIVHLSKAGFVSRYYKNGISRLGRNCRMAYFIVEKWPDGSDRPCGEWRESNPET